MSQGSGPKNFTGKRWQLDCGGEIGLGMLDLLRRWSSESGEEEILIDAIVVESTVGDVMVAAVMVGGIVVVKLARVGAKGTTAGTSGAFTSVSNVSTDRAVLLEFEEVFFVT